MIRAVLPGRERAHLDPQRRHPGRPRVVPTTWTASRRANTEGNGVRGRRPSLLDGLRGWALLPPEPVRQGPGVRPRRPVRPGVVGRRRPPAMTCATRQLVLLERRGRLPYEPGGAGQTSMGREHLVDRARSAGCPLLMPTATTRVACRSGSASTSDDLLLRHLDGDLPACAVVSLAPSALRTFLAVSVLPGTTCRAGPSRRCRRPRLRRSR